MPLTMPDAGELYAAMGRMIVRFYGRVDGAECRLASRAALGCSGLDSVFLNFGIIFGDGPGADGAEARLREFVSRLRACEVGGYLCFSESVRTALAPVACGLGLEPLVTIPLMMRAGGVSPAMTQPAESGSAPCVVERAGDPEGVFDLLRVSEEAFGLPGDLYGQIITPELVGDPSVAVYLCRCRGTVVSCACVVEDDGLVGVSGLATLPEQQGRGYGSCVLATVFGAYSTARAFYLTASDQGRPFYRAHGFAVVDAADAWVLPPPEGRG